jgi:PKHD-type hydroxylase
MQYEIFRLLEPEEVQSIVRELAGQPFVDGKVTAAGAARAVKNNLQIERQSSATAEADRLVNTALHRCRDLQVWALPRRFVKPMYSRYEPGMEYGPHVDNSFMGGPNGVRTDLAVTIFLSPPATYDGGELAIHLPAGQEEIKLDAGEAVVYPASFVHHVAPVTLGVRLAAITWVQSAVRDERIRAILWDLSLAMRKTEQRQLDELSLLLNKSYHNLVRYAAQS